MLIIIHGSDIVASRKFFLEERQRFVNSVVLGGSQITLTDLAQLLEGGGLFENSKQLFVEQFLTERKKSTEKEAILKYLIAHAKANSIMLWEGKELDRTALSQFKEATIKSFKLPSTLFTFLEEIKPKNGRQLVGLFHKSLEKTEAEMIFFMMVRQFRILLALSDPASPTGGETITEVSRLAPWQSSRFERQAALFRKDLLEQLYMQLFQIELGQKTGTLSSSLVSKIDFFLAEI